MVSKMKRMWSSMDLEERILNAGAIVGLVALFCPWLSGEWLGGDSVTYTGLGFYTSFIGLAVCIMLLLLLLMTIVPLLGGPILVRKKYRDIVRLILATQSTILILAALSVLTKVTYEFSRIEIRFGLYLALSGCIVTTIYAFLRYQEERKNHVPELFHHPEDSHFSEVREESHIPPPPPPPPPAPLAPEEHHLHR